MFSDTWNNLKKPRTLNQKLPKWVKWKVITFWPIFRPGTGLNKCWCRSSRRWIPGAHFVSTPQRIKVHHTIQMVMGEEWGGEVEFSYIDQWYLIFFVTKFLKRWRKKFSKKNFPKFFFSTQKRPNQQIFLVRFRLFFLLRISLI